MSEQTASQPSLQSRVFDPKGVFRKNTKPLLYLGAAALVILAAIFSSYGKKTTASAASKNAPPQPLVQDNTENNVQDLKDQVDAAKQKQAQDAAAQAALDPSLVNATAAQRTVASGYGANGQGSACVPGQPCPTAYAGGGQPSAAQQERQMLAAKESDKVFDGRFSSNLAFVQPATRESLQSQVPLGYATVRAVDEQANRLTVERQDGQQVSYDPKRLRGITAYRETPRTFANGDRLQFTTNDRELGISNRHLGTVEKATPMELRVRLDGEEQRTVSFRPEQMRHFDHGYAVTSHSSQGLTADRVLINVDVSAHRDLVNQRFAYVAVSRAAYDVRLYTDDGTRLEKDLGRDVSKTAAIELNSPKAKTMNFQNEHAHTKEVNQDGQKMPVEVYASTLSPEVIREDLRFAERQLEQGISRFEATSNLIGDHVRRIEAEPSTLSLVERYSSHLTDLVRHQPNQSSEKMLDVLQPSLKDATHWEPAITALGLGQSDSFVWRREHADIQSYQQIANPKAWLHIDNSGHFFDRGARPILKEQAGMELGMSLGGANHQGQAQDVSNCSGMGRCI